MSEETKITSIQDAIDLMNKTTTIEQWEDNAYAIKHACYDNKIPGMDIRGAREMVNKRLDEICDMPTNDQSNKMIRLNRGDDDHDKIVEVSASEYILMRKIVAKFGTLYDARMTAEESHLIYDDIEERADLSPRVCDTFYMHER